MWNIFDEIFNLHMHSRSDDIVRSRSLTDSHTDKQTGTWNDRWTDSHKHRQKYWLSILVAKLYFMS